MQAVNPSDGTALEGLVAFDCHSHFRSLLFIPACFTSRRLKDFCKKMEGKTNFSRHLKQFDGLT